MARERNILCKNYKAEHFCALGKDAIWRGYCQKCRAYEPNPNRLPSKVDNKRKKLEKIKEKEGRKYF